VISPGVLGFTMDRQGKRKLKDELKIRLQGANAAIVTEYRGLSFAEMSQLRVELRKAGAELTVAKNRIVIKAIEDGVDHASPLKTQLKGPSALVTIKGDAAATAKALLKFSSEHEALKVKGGVLDGRGLTVKDLKALSELPSKEVLLARLVGTLVAPHRGLLGVLNGVPRQLVQVINAIKEKKAGS
jgi:large subunit ribosomal protein L10